MQKKGPEAFSSSPAPLSTSELSSETNWASINNAGLWKLGCPGRTRRLWLGSRDRAVTERLDPAALSGIGASLTQLALEEVQSISEADRGGTVSSSL